MPPRSEGRKRPNSNQDDLGGRSKKSIKTETKAKAVKKEPKATPKSKATLKAQPTPKPEDKLIIALDFGTTFSGIAYSFKSQQDPKVVAITNWPGNTSKTFNPDEDEPVRC